MSQQTSFRNRVESPQMAMTTFLRRPFFLPKIVQKKSLKLLQTLKKGFKKNCSITFFWGISLKEEYQVTWIEVNRPEECTEKNPSCDHAVHFYFQSREPQSIACRDFIWVPESLQLHPLSRYHGETLNVCLLPFYTATSSRETQEIF